MQIVTINIEDLPTLTQAMLRSAGFRTKFIHYFRPTNQSKKQIIIELIRLELCKSQKHAYSRK